MIVRGSIWERCRISTGLSQGLEAMAKRRSYGFWGQWVSPHSGAIPELKAYLHPDRYGPERELYREAVSKGQRLKMNGECTAQTPGNPMIRHGGVGPPFLISFQ